MKRYAIHAAAYTRACSYNYCYPSFHLHFLKNKLPRVKKLTVILLLAALTFGFASGQAGSASTGNGPEKENYMGYMIRVLQTPGNGYGYDLFFKGRMVLHEPVNPFTLSPIGLSKKEDMLKVAHYQIQEFWRSNNRAIAKRNLRVSASVAKKLNIEMR